MPRAVAPDELAFLASWLREPDLDSVTAHLARVAYRIATSGNEDASYRCVRQMYFLEPRLPNHALYAGLLATNAERRAAGATTPWVDVGAGLGTDVRKLRADGWPRDQVLAVDVAETLWRYGLDLFADAAAPPCDFVIATIGSGAAAPPPLAALTGASAVVSLMAVLHVLNEGAVDALLRAARRLLAPGTGVLIGVCLGTAAAPGPWTPPALQSVPTARWLHTRDSLAALLSAVGFVDVDVRATEHAPHVRHRDVARHAAAASAVGLDAPPPPRAGWERYLSFSGRRAAAEPRGLDEAVAAA